MGGDSSNTVRNTYSCILGPTLNQAVLGDPQASSSGVLRPRPRMASNVAPSSGIEPVNIDHSDCDGKAIRFIFNNFLFNYYIRNKTIYIKN